MKRNPVTLENDGKYEKSESVIFRFPFLYALMISCSLFKGFTHSKQSVLEKEEKKIQ